MTARHLTPSERRSRASAAAAVARALAHTRRTPPEDDDERLAHLYPGITRDRAREIRQELDGTHQPATCPACHTRGEIR